MAEGRLATYEPQRYAVLEIQDVLYNGQAAGLGTASFDRPRGLFYVVGFYADDAAPVIHAWKVGDIVPDP